MGKITLFIRSGSPQVSVHSGFMNNVMMALRAGTSVIEWFVKGTFQNEHCIGPSRFCEYIRIYARRICWCQSKLTQMLISVLKTYRTTTIERQCFESKTSLWFGQALKSRYQSHQANPDFSTCSHIRIICKSDWSCSIKYYKSPSTCTDADLSRKFRENRTTLHNGMLIGQDWLTRSYYPLAIRCN